MLLEQEDYSPLSETSLSSRVSAFERGKRQNDKDETELDGFVNDKRSLQTEEMPNSDGVIPDPFRCPDPNGPLVVLNVGGRKFQTFAATLERFPRSLLGSRPRRQWFYRKDLGEYFFDRHRKSFDAILFFYQSGGYLKRPVDVSVDIFVEEILFFDLGDDVLEKFWEAEGYRKPEDPPMPTNSIQKKIWLLMEYPDSSILARICAFLSIFVIVLSTCSFCVETLPIFQVNETVAKGDPADLPFFSRESPSNPFYVIEILCIIWFTIELSLRFLSSPSKIEFMKGILNWVDFIAIAPFFINLAVKADKSSSMSFTILRVIRLVRVFRIFKLSRHSRGLQVLAMTFKASVREFCLFCFFLVIAIVLVSSAMYFAEGSVGEENHFKSIPHGFWYSIVTMTTVGYGDMYPQGIVGKMIGSASAIGGVLMLALPVPVIVENFKYFYRRENRLAHVDTLRHATTQQMSVKREIRIGVQDDESVASEL